MRIGKCKIDVTSRGCIMCGTFHSSGWRVVRTVAVLIGKQKLTLEIHICADCDKGKGEIPQMELEL